MNDKEIEIIKLMPKFQYSCALSIHINNAFHTYQEFIYHHGFKCYKDTNNTTFHICPFHSICSKDTRKIIRMKQRKELYNTLMKIYNLKELIK